MGQYHSGIKEANAKEKKKGGREAANIRFAALVRPPRSGGKWRQEGIGYGQWVIARIYSFGGPSAQWIIKKLCEMEWWEETTYLDPILVH